MRVIVRRSGFTLIETLVALVLLGLSVAVVSRVVVGQHRLAATASERAALQVNLRTGLSLLRRELGELGGGSAGSDLLAFGPDSLTYRAIRGVGAACAVSATEVRVRRYPWGGFRLPQPIRDSLLLLVAADSAASRVARWLSLPISSVTTATCAGAPALALGTTIDPMVAADSIRLDAPVRTFEVMQLRLYRVAPAWWLGARSVSGGEIIQPVLGPLDPGGLRLAYFDSIGAPASQASSVRAIRVTLIGVTARAVRPTADAAAAVLHDSAEGWLPLRNLER